MFTYFTGYEQKPEIQQIASIDLRRVRITVFTVFSSENESSSAFYMRSYTRYPLSSCSGITQWNRQESSKNTQQPGPVWSMVNWCLHWIHYQQAGGSSFCNLFPGNRLYADPVAFLREKRLGKPNFPLNAWMFYWGYTTELMEEVNTIGDIRERGNECEKERASRLSSFCRIISISSFIILA